MKSKEQAGWYFAALCINKNRFACGDNLLGMVGRVEGGVGRLTRHKAWKAIHDEANTDRRASLTAICDLLESTGKPWSGIGP